MTTCVNIK